MRTSVKHFWLPVVALLALQACRLAQGPAGFWKSYRPEWIAARHSDQGPWGGERWMIWRGPRGTFTFADARAFAERHGWKLVEQSPYSEAAAASSPGKHAAPGPSLFPEPSVIGRFDSKWIREDPGTGETTPAFGFVQVADDGRQMYVYHFWGNG